MTNPFRLAAATAAWSLHNSRAALARAARDEAAQIAAEALTAPAVLHSPVWGQRRALGGHSDPVGGARLLTADRPPRVNRAQQLADSTTATLTWLAGMLHTPGGGDPLDRLMAVLPTLRPANARDLWKWLREADQRIRLALGLDDDLAALPGAPACPACGVRMLRAHTAAPDVADWTVVCGNGCLCSGQGCRCGMPGAVEGAPHIWPRAVVVGAVAGATPHQAQAA